MLHLTITGPRIFALLFALYPVIDVLVSRICQKHRCIIGFACLFGIEALDLCLTVFEQSGGDLRGERLFALLKEAVILPHHELTATIPAVEVFLALIDVFTCLLYTSLIQSFAPGETTPEQAHEIGRQLADEVLQGKYPYVLTTHIDKGHVHNHIIFCAVDMVNQRKYVSNRQSYAYIRRTSDRLCKEHGLSVVMPGQDRGNLDCFAHMPMRFCNVTLL